MLPMISSSDIIIVIVLFFRLIFGGIESVTRNFAFGSFRFSPAFFRKFFRHNLVDNFGHKVFKPLAFLPAKNQKPDDDQSYKSIN